MQIWREREPAAAVEDEHTDMGGRVLSVPTDAPDAEAVVIRGDCSGENGNGSGWAGEERWSGRIPP